MKKEMISDWQGISLITIFLSGSSSLLTLGIGAKQDFWIPILLSILISLPMCYIFSRLYYLFPEKNLLDVIEICFGKLIGKIVIILFTLFCFDEGTEVLINGTQFVSTTSLKETPRIVISVSLLIICIWAVKEGIESLGRWAQCMLIPFGLIVLISFFCLIPSMELTKLLPVFTQNTKVIFKSTLTAFTFPFGEIFVFSMAFSSFRTRKTPYKVYFIGLLIGSLIPLMISTANVLVLGVNDTGSYFYPAYFSLRRISIGTAIQRIEVLASIIYNLGTFLKLSVYLLAFCKGLSKIFGYDDYRFIVIPAGLLIANLSYFYFNDMLKFWEYAENVWVYYSLPFEVILPVLIIIVAEIKKKRLLLKS